MHAIINGRIVLTDKILDGCALLFDKKVIGIVSHETVDAAWQKEKCWQGKPLTLTDARGAYVSPGFINLHIHGCAGVDTMDSQEDTLAVMSRFLVRTGVTAFLPTTMTCEKTEVYKTLEHIRKTMTVITRRRGEKHEALQKEKDPDREGMAVNHSAGLLPECSGADLDALSAGQLEGKRSVLPGAKVLGAYLEGPFISSLYKGAQKEAFIEHADFSYVKEFSDVIKVVVLAPETLGKKLAQGKDEASVTLAQEQRTADQVLPDDFQLGTQNPDGRVLLKNFIGQCKIHHIVVSLGHSAADYDTALQAIREGASHVTHLCNAMTGLHHRAPGLVGAALDSPAICELIADNLHVHPAVQRLIYRTKGAAGIELITDSMRACGLQDGVSELGGQTVYVKNGEARLADGTIAGSVVTLNRAMANFRKNTGATVPEIVRMVTENQAQELGLFEKIGSLSPGAAADITLFDDNFTVLNTFVDGCEVYKTPAFR